ncbi:hypothetical protein FRC09_009879 [Ceratobasidium sp. 395]|nr:hypothetical protein FRC09_009879 [Ceratobasidium sp. 395]
MPISLLTTYILVFSDPALQPEYKQVPAPKQSKVIKLDNVPEISTKFKKKHGGPTQEKELETKPCPP